MATKAVAREVMTVAQISKPGGDFEVVERELPDPGTGQVRIKIQACGVCHSDVFTKEGMWPGIGILCHKFATHGKRPLKTVAVRY